VEWGSRQRIDGSTVRLATLALGCLRYRHDEVFTGHTAMPAAGTSTGVAGRHFAHRWRHSYATSLVRRGEDIHVVQRLMGHSNIATTSRYLHLSDADLLAAVDRAFPEG